MSSFKDRLKYLELLSLKKNAGKENSKKRKKVHFTLPASWEKAGEFTYKKIVRLKNPVTITDFSESPVDFKECTPGDLVFFDLETTGLSGGAGNICFLIGIGRLIDTMLEIEQVFLSDFPGEPEFLTLITPYFDKKKLFVSYNGKSFDSHLIKSRFLLNRMECEIEKQFDLLHISRRFFKRMIGNCSLGDIEEKVLSIRRENDVSGFEVPDIYFSFLRSGETDDLERVFDHNFQDILSLVHLFNFIITLVSRSSGYPLCNVDLTALGRYFIETGKSGGIDFLYKAFNKGDMMAGEYLSLYYKREKEWEKARHIWEKMAQNAKSRFAAIELSKYYEHRKREYKKALEWVQKVFEFCLPLSIEERMELIKRKERIERKMEQRE